jgi:hypothetical protein
MTHSSDPDLVKVTEIFLVPSSFLVAALGTADSNIHRAAVSLIGCIVSTMWWVSSREAIAERESSDPVTSSHLRSRRIRIMTWLPVFFMVAWIISVVAHAILWNRPLGHV